MMRENSNFYYLTGALIVLMLLIAVSEQSLGRYQVQFVRVGLAASLLVATLSVRDEHRLFRISLGLVGAIIVISGLDYLLDDVTTTVVYLMLIWLYLVGMAIQTFRRVLFSPGRIDLNRIIGAIAIYLLLGLIWAVAYVAIETIAPGAFAVGAVQPWLASLPEFVYFSFVSLTTLGFGDIAPMAPIAKFGVYMEAIVGQLYLAIMIAGLVSIGFRNAPADRQRPPRA